MKLKSYFSSCNALLAVAKTNVVAKFDCATLVLLLLVDWLGEVVSVVDLCG